MAEADVENFPGEGEPPLPEGEEDSGPLGGLAYWKTYPGIWKILEVILGVISLICIIYCFIPEWTWSDLYEHGRECPADWVMALIPENEGYYLKSRIIETKVGGAIILRSGKSNKDTTTPSGPIRHRAYTNSSNGELLYNGQKVFECYGSLTFPNGTLGMGRQDIWLYVWAVTVICGVVVSIAIIVLQIRNSSFGTRTQLLVIFYYAIIAGAQLMPAISMIAYIVRNLTVPPKITLPRAVPCLVGGLFTTLNVILYYMSFVWSIKHKAS